LDILNSLLGSVNFGGQEGSKKSTNTSSKARKGESFIDRARREASNLPNDFFLN